MVSRRAVNITGITPIAGILNLDKPPRISSAGAVRHVKRMLPRGVKIGHAGTLDPFATGVLVLLIGPATRLAERFMSEPKQYQATIRLGATTETLDPDSPESLTPDAQPPSRETIDGLIPQFIGQISQMPPAYSALKIEGQPAYKLARRGKTPQLSPRIVHVYAITVIQYRWPTLSLLVDCGRGTYIRALARDIGQALGVQGYLTSLRRTRVGPCAIAQAVSLEQLAADGVEPHLLPVEQAPPKQ